MTEGGLFTKRQVVAIYGRISTPETLEGDVVDIAVMAGMQDKETILGMAVVGGLTIGEYLNQQNKQQETSPDQSQRDQAEENQETVTRYMSEGEAEETKRTGEVPNYGKDGKPRPTHVTEDAPTNSASEAQEKYEIEKPTHRVTVPKDRATNVGPAPDGRPTTSGGGSQSATPDPIPVEPNEVQELED
ncbi:hypothetical protein [Cerasicoccus arenae]|uniref:Uncharacterized protein n=1 Tax=Cerasicoccus arenae TaxID=424488 RepID=A0A8J3DJ20_9BACT|nr:hypothetical protein [Cerasicoccus arenae]MBK1860082.1 hypothetical protein [Cerasicoccus arenae]GHC14189.1 hypothetical protein GCM10007047_34270 [Cerasicoccus arenae]